MSVKKYCWAIKKNLFAYDNEDSTFFHTLNNSKNFNITSKYFSLFNNKPPPNCDLHVTRDFLTCFLVRILVL